MKKLSIATSVLLSLCFASCLKDKPNVDLASTQSTYIAEISTASTNGTPDAPSSGLDFFNGATLDATAGDPDSVSFTVNIASDFPPKSDVAVTLAVNDQARLSYIADPTKVQFAAFPSNAFKLVSTTATIKAGSRLATFWVVFTHANLDPTKSYMLPISITSATGATISGNLSTIYFHIIGNPIAGSYSWEWIRYNEDPPAGSPDFDVNEGTTPFIPVSPTTVAVPSGTGVTYDVSFVNTGGTLSNFSVAFPSSGPGSPAMAGITITSGPSVVLADPINHKYTFNFAYLNSGGAARNITDKFQ